jgi:ABC-type multidrug transport system ATPase subunit
MEFSIQHICKSFNRKPILKNLNLIIKSNESVGIIGSNGSGKTTLLKIISGLMRPDSGHGLLNNLSIFGTDYNYRKDVCYWGHQIDCYPNMTAFENISLFLQLRNDLKTKNQINSVLECVGLKNSKNQLVGEFSAGMIQRFHIARLKLSSWTLGIIDEPTNALDEPGLSLLSKSINEFKIDKKSLILSSHNIDFIKKHCKIIYQLKNGSLEIIN